MDPNRANFGCVSIFSILILCVVLCHVVASSPRGDYYANQVTLHEEKCHVTFNCKTFSSCQCCRGFEIFSTSSKCHFSRAFQSLILVDFRSKLLHFWFSDFISYIFQVYFRSIFSSFQVRIWSILGSIIVDAFHSKFGSFSNSQSCKRKWSVHYKS